MSARLDRARAELAEEIRELIKAEIQVHAAMSQGDRDAARATADFHHGTLELAIDELAEAVEASATAEIRRPRPW